MCLMSLSTPSAAGPFQCGQVAGQRLLYLKHQQDINANDLKFEDPLPEPTPEIPSALLKAEDANPDQNDADRTQAKCIF